MALINLLVPDRGTPGMAGMEGNPGPEPEIEILSGEELSRLLEK